MDALSTHPDAPAGGARFRRTRRLLVIVGVILAMPVILALFIANMSDGGRR